ncbi:M81 family metallopeptidase [Tropicimonas aquimaris]|uniref:Microcystinase C n=1 Tax=Tropicimonas aquimaris TaxID=914152 RepID=A0ABW3IMD0_9RHOB
MRIAIVGFQHETNSFSPGVTTAEAFETPFGWPRLSRGEELLERLPGTAVPSAGALAELKAAGGTPVPIFWAIALPSAPVDHAAFEGYRNEILDGLRAALPLDGVFLELHGAMATTEEEDAEGAIIAAVRDLVGSDLPIVVSLDLHTNLTQRMVSGADFLDAYRTYPHVDMSETGARAMRRMISFVNGASRPAAAFREVPFLLPLTAQATGAEPVCRLYRAAQEAGGDGRDVTLTLGFPLADIASAGPAIAAYAPDAATAEALAEAQLALWTAAETEFAAPILPPAEAIAAARAVPPGPGPVVLADVQDNPGGGGTNDTTGLLQAMVDAGLDGALLVHIADAEAVAAAQVAGPGAVVDVPLGGKSDPETGAPVPGPWRVCRLGDGRFTGQGPMYSGNAIDMGPVALLERNGVQVIVAAGRMQASEPALIRHLGIEPAELPFLAVKSSVHFRGAYQEMARGILHVDAPGRVTMDLTRLPYRRALRPPAGTRRNSGQDTEKS